MVINTATHNQSECREYVSMEHSGTNEMDILAIDEDIYFPKCRDLGVRRGIKRL